MIILKTNMPDWPQKYIKIKLSNFLKEKKVKFQKFLPIPLLPLPLTHISGSSNSVIQKNDRCPNEVSSLGLRILISRVTVSRFGNFQISNSPTDQSDASRVANPDSNILGCPELNPDFFVVPLHPSTKCMLHFVFCINFTLIWPILSTPCPCFSFSVFKLSFPY